MHPRTNDADAIAQSFSDLSQKLTDIIHALDRMNENPHFAYLLVRETIEELAQLAEAGRARVGEHHEYFTRHPLYADGMFWYNLCQGVSSTIAKFAWMSGASLNAEILRPLIVPLIRISWYTTRRTGDITKRNHEALTEVLWLGQDETLVDHARAEAERMADEEVIKFVQDAIQRAASRLLNYSCSGS